MQYVSRFRFVRWGGACVFLTSLRGAGVRVGSPRPSVVSLYPPPLLRVGGVRVCSSPPCAVQGCVLVHHVPPWFLPTLLLLFSVLGGCVCVPHVPARCRGACWFTTSPHGFFLPFSSSPCWGGACVFLTSLRGAGVRVGSPRPPMVSSYPPPLSLL